MWRQLDLASPWLLSLLGFVPLVYWWLAHQVGGLRFSSLALVPRAASSWRTRLAWLPDGLMALAVAMVVLGLAGPRRGDRNAKVRRDGIAMVMALDISSSMMALDLAEPQRELTRLDAVKRVFERFVLGGQGLAGRADDAIGLVSFARYADTKSPLTLDHSNVVTAARRLALVDDPNEDGTAIGAGLALAVERLRAYPAKGKVVLLLTDGEQTVNEVSIGQAIDAAVEAGVRVYTIGAGTNGMAPVRVPTGDGGSVLRQVEVHIDEGALREIAEKTKGQYFRATDAASLASIYGQINTLERVRLEDTQFVDFVYYFDVCIAVALGALALALALRATVLRRLPS